MPMKNKSIILLLLAALQVAMILGSWLYSAAMPDSPVRAILSDAGIRWFFGTFVANLSSPLLIYIILLDISLGSCLYSGLWRAFLTTIHTRKECVNLIPSLFVILAEIAVVLLLILPRHAILLSATGGLFPSSFSASLVPVIAFVLLSASITYGLFSGSLHNYIDAIHCCIRGGSNLKFIIAFYILAMQLYKMIMYVIGQ